MLKIDKITLSEVNNLIEDSYIDKKEITVSKMETLSNEELYTRLQDIIGKSNIKVIENEERERHVPVIEEKSSKGSLAKN